MFQSQKDVQFIGVRFVVYRYVHNNATAAFSESVAIANGNWEEGLTQMVQWSASKSIYKQYYD